ncbi:MAG TPA: ABC transporter ATP-binding protein [Chloroflexota bacterium]|nr:ABC transporter ATP-binding protein [Chloroflexota bacterium]
MASSLQAPAEARPQSGGGEAAFLSIRGLRKSYGAVVAADVDRLEARAGQLLTLLGPSGCGKTTTLRCIAGLVQPELGSIQIGGREITGLPTHRRNLGMVFQNYAIFPHMDVFDNVAYGLHGRGLGKDQVRSRVADALELVELSGYERRYRHQLSGGQQQRVALARAIVYQPDVLLLDEPFSNLDAKLRKSMRLEVRKLQQRLKLTTVFVTHDQQEALSLSDVVAVMNAGRVEQVGTPAEVYEAPSSEFVADFIGSTNLLPGVVRGSPLGVVDVELDGGAVVSIPADAGLAAGARVKVLAKPEAVRLVPAPGGTLHGTLSAVAYLGAVTQFQVELASCSIEVLMPAGEALAPAIGDAVGVALRPETLRVLAS